MTELIEQEPTMTSRQQQGVESRDRILDAAAEIIYDRGYSGASVSEIRKRSGLPASSIYWHFGNKDGVIAAVLQRYSDHFFQSLPAFEQPAGADPIEAFTAFMVHVGEAATDDDRLFRVLDILALETPDDSTEVHASVRRIRGEGLGFLLGPIRTLCDAIDSERNPVEIATFCLAVLDGYVIARRVNPESSQTAVTWRQLATAAVALARS